MTEHELVIKKKAKQKLLKEIDLQLQSCDKSIKPCFVRAWDEDNQKYVKRFRGYPNFFHIFKDKDGLILRETCNFTCGTAQYGIIKTEHALKIFKNRIKRLNIKYF